MRAAREAAQRLQALHHPTTTKGKCAGNEGVFVAYFVVFVGWCRSSLHLPYHQRDTVTRTMGDVLLEAIGVTSYYFNLCILFLCGKQLYYFLSKWLKYKIFNKYLKNGMAVQAEMTRFLKDSSGTDRIPKNP